MRSGTIFDFILLLCWNGALYALCAIIVWQLFKRLKLLRRRWGWGMIIMDIIVLVPIALLVNYFR